MGQKLSVLVTGATGFLGKYVVQDLLQAGCRVIAAGRNEQQLKVLEGMGAQTFRGSLGALAQTRMEVDAVIHGAALSTVWGTKADFYLPNVAGTQQMIDFCFRNKVSRLVHISSPSIYSVRGNRINIGEDSADTANEMTNYIWSKLRAEERVQAAAARGLETVILRPRGLIGAEDPSIVPRFLAINRKIGIPLVNNGKNLVDLTSVENVALACRLALTSQKAVGGTYNITNDDPRPLREITQQLFDLMGVTPRFLNLPEALLYNAASLFETIYRAFNIRREPPLTRYAVCTLAYSQTLDISRARADLGYEPLTPLDKGIENCAISYAPGTAGR